MRGAAERFVGPMAERSNGRGTNQSLETTSPDQVRNVVLVGPSQSGKTTLVEALLLAGGAITRAGTIAEHNTVCDHEDHEQEHERSSSLAVAPVVHKDIKPDNGTISALVRKIIGFLPASPALDAVADDPTTSTTNC